VVVHRPRRLLDVREPKNRVNAGLLTPPALSNANDERRVVDAGTLVLTLVALPSATRT
jgi:hypothetical protein